MTSLDRYERQRAHDRYQDPQVACLKHALADAHRLLSEEKQRTAECVLASIFGGFCFIGLLWLLG